MKAPLPLLVSGLGIAQIVSWGSLYYPISVLGDSMQRELGVSATVLFAAFTLSLLIPGMAAPMVGRLMEAHGPRAVLCNGSLLGMGRPCTHGSRQRPCGAVRRRIGGGPGPCPSFC